MPVQQERKDGKLTHRYAIWKHIQKYDSIMLAKMDETGKAMTWGNPGHGLFQLIIDN